MKSKLIEKEDIQSMIFEIRGQKVMLDSDLAKLYQVSTGRLNEQFKRNMDRFPEDFAFQLTLCEWESLRSQIAILKIGRGQHRKYLPYVFTEHGTLALSSVLNSDVAVKVNQVIIRVFVAIRKNIYSNPEFKLLKEKIRYIEQAQETLALNQKIENKVLTTKMQQVSKEVHRMSDIFDQFQNNHLIIKRPDDL